MKRRSTNMLISSQQQKSNMNHVVFYENNRKLLHELNISGKQINVSNIFSCSKN